MVGGFLKAFKSEAKRLLLCQNSGLDFFEIEKLSPRDLAKVAVEEEAAKKSASKQRKKSKKKSASEKPPSKYPLEPSLLPEGVSTEVEPKAGDLSLVPDDQSLIASGDANVLAPESEMEFDV